jgi:hypothetical protein
VTSGDRKLRDEPTADEPEVAQVRSSLIVNRQSPTHNAPVRLNAWTTITDPSKFIEATLGDLSAYAAGRASWVAELVDEKVAALRVCGIEAELRRIQ